MLVHVQGYSLIKSMSFFDTKKYFGTNISGMSEKVIPSFSEVFISLYWLIYIYMCILKYDNFMHCHINFITKQFKSNIVKC